MLLSPEFRDVVVGVSYLIAAILFVTGLKGLTHPRTAVSGNVQSAVGMLIAVLSCFSFLPGQWLLRSETLPPCFAICAGRRPSSASAGRSE